MTPVVIYMKGNIMYPRNPFDMDREVDDLTREYSFRKKEALTSIYKKAISIVVIVATGTVVLTALVTKELTK